mgnify:CR=1 FL=1
MFNTHADVCETYGHDLATGAEVGGMAYRAQRPDGRAFLRTEAYRPAAEEPTPEWPFQLTTGRTVYHFHTRTKTGRAAELRDAAPTVWVEMNAADAEEVGVTEGDVVRVTSARGAIHGPVRVTDIRRGVVFVPFHYGYWDGPDGAGPTGEAGTAANELTRTIWDPVSKQPLLKVAAVAVALEVRGDGAAPAPDIGGSARTRLTTVTGR